MKIRRQGRRRTVLTARVAAPVPTRLPADFLDELAFELDASLQEARRQAERLAILSELHRVATTTARRLRRPVTILDVIESANDERERDRLTELVKRLRA